MSDRKPACPIPTEVVNQLRREHRAFCPREPAREELPAEDVPCRVCAVLEELE